MNKRVWGLLLVVGLGIAGWWWAPSPIDAQAYQPSEPAPLSGAWAVNQALLSAQRIALVASAGAEDVAITEQGVIYVGTEGGDIVRILPSGEQQRLVNTGGRVLGLHWSAMGTLIAADAYRGLLQITEQGKVSVLVNQVAGEPLGLVDDVDVASDGSIYFSDASLSQPLSSYRLDIMEAKGSGRLLHYDPRTQNTQVLMQGLKFANGVALSQAEDFVLVVETGAYQVWRYWLRGPQQGQAELWVSGLPGFPDGISGNRQGEFWLTIFAQRSALLDPIHPYPWLKNLVAKLPAALRPGPPHYGLLAQLDESGQVLASYHDPEGKFLYNITSAQQWGDRVYLGSLHTQHIGVLALP